MERKTDQTFGQIIAAWRDEMNRAVQELAQLESAHRHAMAHPHRFQEKNDRLIARNDLAKLWGKKPTNDGKPNGRDSEQLKLALSAFLINATIGELNSENIARVVLDESVKADRVLGVAKAKAPSRTRCAHHPAIRRFHAIAKDKHLNTKNKEVIRAAVQNHLRRTIMSRDELTGTEWFKLGTAVERGELAW